MLGNMMNEQLLISGVLEHAIKNNANTEIVSNTVEGGIHRYTIKDSAKVIHVNTGILINLIPLVLIFIIVTMKLNADTREEIPSICKPKAQ